MKKAFSVLAALILMLAAGCKNREAPQNTPPPAPTAFTSEIKAIYKGVEMTAEFTQNSAEDFTVDFLTPKALEPLSLEYKNGSCTVIYNGLEFESSPDRFPQAEICALLTYALSDAAENFELQTSFANNIWTYKGTGERGVFSLTRDAETGNWLEFRADGANLYIAFNNFSLK